MSLTNHEPKEGPLNNHIQFDAFNQLPQGTHRGASSGAHHKPMHGISGLAGQSSNGVRGYSRGSKASQKSQRGTICTGSTKDFQRMSSCHPNTAGSQKRQLALQGQSAGVSQQAQAPSNTTTILQSKRSALNAITASSKQHSMMTNNGAQDIEYVPLSTVSYTSQQQPKKVDGEIKTLGVGGLNVLNEGLRTNSTKENFDLAGKPLKTDFSFQENINSKFQDFKTNLPDEAGRNAANIKLSLSNMNLVANQTPPTEEAMDFKVGKGSKYQIPTMQTNFMSKRISGNNNTIAGDPRAGNYEEDQQAALPNIPSISNLNQVKPTMHPSINPHGPPGSQSQSKGTRKMSVAAKSGQMQVFGGMGAGNRIGGLKQHAMSQPDADTDFPISVNKMQKLLQDHNSDQLNQTEVAIEQQVLHESNLIPSNSAILHKVSISQGENLNDYKNAAIAQQIQQQVKNNTPLGSRQFESYLDRRQIIEQQREKKQELLKQLDMGLAQRQQVKQKINAIQLENGQVRAPQHSLTAENVYGSLYHHHDQTEEPLDNSLLRKVNNPPDLSVNGISPLAVIRNKSENPTAGTIPEKGHHHYNSSLPPEMSIIEKNLPQSISPSRGKVPQRGPNPLGNSQTFTKHLTNPINLDRRRFKPQVMDQLQSTGQVLSGPPIHHSNLSIQTGKQFMNQQMLSNPQSSKHFSQDFSHVSPSNLQHNINIIGSNNSHNIPQIAGVSVGQTQGMPGQPVPPPPPAYQPTVPQQHQQKDETLSTKASTINSRITRKLEGGRPHKVYDYMFVQMSNELFSKEYMGKKIQLIGQEPPRDPVQSPKADESKKSKFLSPDKSPAKGGKMFGISSQSPQNAMAKDPPNLNGLVKIKAYDSQVTDELPSVQCNLLPTQLDHLKVLICEQEDKNHPKLTSEAVNRFEIEKQNQIKQYMEDIIAKLQQKDRRFKVTVKRKFVEDALFNSTSIRVASVYVIVVNREKTYDPLLNQKAFKSRKVVSDSRFLDSSSEEDEAEKQAREDYQRQQDLLKGSGREGTSRRSTNHNFVSHNKKKSMYDSDTNGNGQDGMNSTSASSNVPQFKKLLQDKSEGERLKSKRSGHISAGPSFKRQNRKDDDGGVAYKYVPPKKEFPAKYGPTKVRIVQDVKAHIHHQKHPINIFLNQYNEFIKLVFKNQKQISQASSQQPNQPSRFNVGYVLGLGKALGLNLKRDALSEQNMKSRDHINMLKEKLIFCLWKKLGDENKDIAPPPLPSIADKAQGSNTDLETEDSLNSSTNCNNTPKSKKASESIEKAEVEVKYQFTMPPVNIIYKYFIGKGNNSMMVRSLFKNRYWWVQHDKEEMERCNFCWTQIKKTNIMEVLHSKFPNKKSGIKTCCTFNQPILATPQQKSNKKKKPQPTSEKAVSAKVADKAQENATKLLETKLYNKIEDNFHMNNKKALFLNMKNYYEAIDQDVFDNLPVTFHIKNGLDDHEFTRFKNFYFKVEEDIKNKKAQIKQRRKEEKEQKDKVKDEDAISPQASPEKEGKADKPEKPEKPAKEYYQSAFPPKNIWIIKPGENTNRGHGIQVAKDFNEIRDIIEDSTAGRRRTCIVQKYIHNPLLIHRRKFDIRTFVLLTSINGNIKMFIYDEGYLRTSCREYSINNLNNKLVHLTNDAVQKRAEEYGKFEPGNKLSYNEFQQFIDKTYPDLNVCFERDILPQMNKMTTDIFRACHGKLDPKRRLHCMEVFGLDFMIDDEFKPYLIEVNTNPCLELSSPLLARLIPNMLENAFKLSLDGVFLPPEHFTQKKAFIGDACPENRFELFFDSKVDGPVLEKLFQTKENIIIEMDEDELSEEEEHDDEEE